MSELKPIIEALLLAAAEPISVNDLLKVLSPEEQEEGRASRQEVQGILTELCERYAMESHGIQLVEVNGGYQFRTKPAFAPWIQKMHSPKATRLSKPAIESLSIVSYRQPITRAEVDHIRGVDSGAVMKGLLERHLLKIVGRKEEPGRPLLYGTTPDFLELFGLKDLNELPPLKELEEQAQEMMRRSREIQEEGEEGLEGLEVDLSDMEWLDQQEKDTFEELDSSLRELKTINQKTETLIDPPEPEAEAAPETTPATDEADSA